MNNFQPPQSFEEFKAMVQQLEMLLPEENRFIINDIMQEIEKTGGDKEQLEELMMNLASKIGLKL